MVLWVYMHQVICIKYEQLLNMLIISQCNSFWKLSFLIFRFTQATPRFTCSKKRVLLHLPKAKHCICALGPSPPAISKFHQFFSSASRFPAMSAPHPSAEVTVRLQHEGICDSKHRSHHAPFLTHAGALTSRLLCEHPRAPPRPALKHPHLLEDVLGPLGSSRGTIF